MTDHFNIFQSVFSADALALGIVNYKVLICVRRWDLK